MKVRVPTDDEVVREAEAVLLRHLSAAKVARLWSAWRLGQGDYLAIRQTLFADESVDSLVDQIMAFQVRRGSDE
jgi:hypothetical protein